MSFFHLLNTKKDIWKNIGGHTANGDHWLPKHFLFLLHNSMPTSNNVWSWTFFKPSFLFEFNKRISYRFEGIIFGWSVPLKSFRPFQCVQYLNQISRATLKPLLIFPNGLRYRTAALYRSESHAKVQAQALLHTGKKNQVKNLLSNTGSRVNE